MTAQAAIDAALPPDGVHTSSDDPKDYLDPTPYIESDHPEVIAFAEAHTKGAVTDVEKAVRLFYAVRDEIRYNAYKITPDRESYKASAVLADRQGWCVQKGVLMAAASRAIGLPARIGYADVKNHLCTPRMYELMGTDYFSYHGYVELWLDGRWIKVTPVFNKTLCEKFQVKPQEFDGTEEALFQEYDANGRRHMEYLLDRGTYTDLPFDEIMDDFRERYVPMRPILDGEQSAEGNFEAEAAAQGRTV